MKGPIYKLYLGKPKPEWFELSEKEQEGIVQKLREGLAAVGGKQVIGCNCAWSSEQWAFFGVEEYPNLEAVRKQTVFHTEMHWPFELIDAFSILGTKDE